MTGSEPHAPDFVVIRARRDEHDPLALAKTLSEIRGTPVQDQMIAARGAWGILGEGMTREEARAFAEALRSAGLPCAPGPTRALASLPEAEEVRSVEELPNGAPVLIAVAGMTVTETTRTTQTKGPTTGQKIASTAIMMTTGLPIKVGRRKRKVERTEETESLVFYTDLLYENPSRRLRIAASNFDFSCLEGRMAYQAQMNLKLLMTDMAENAPDAWQNHGARVLLQGKPIRTMGYASLEELEREEVWLMTLRGRTD